MRKGLLVVLSGLSVLALAGCPDKKESSSGTTPSATSTSSTTAASASASASAVASASATPATSGSAAPAYMAHCPTAVPNAKIDVKEVEGGVQVDVTGSDEAMTKDIRDRMKKLEEAAKASSATGQHTGGGGGHGKFGHCAIVTRNTTIESKEIPGGVSATVKAKAKDEADWVRRETKDRLANAKAPGGDGLGKKHMQHCAAAVEGATTKVENTKDGVTVTVTGKGDATVKEIRDRAKHTVDVSKLPDDKKVVHTGEGKGGGALGRCPADPEGDTTIEAKDVEGGVQLTIKPKKPADLANLQKEVKERAAAFGAK